MKRLKNILISGILSVGMVVTSMPIEALAQEIVPGQEEDGTPEQNLYEIVSFEELPEEVCNRNVPVGTALEELNLPETLTVSYRLHTEKQDDEEETDQEPGGNPDDAPGEDGSGSVSGDDIGDDAGDEGNEGNPGEGAGDEGNEENPGDGAGNEGNPGDGSGEEGGEGAPGDDSGDSGDESTPGDDGSEDSPGNNSGDEGNGGDSGNGSGDGGTEENPGGGTGDEGSGGSPGGDTSDEGNGGSPDGDSGEEGSGSGGDTGDGGNVSSPDGGSGNEANGGDSDTDSGNAGNESNPDSNAGNGGTVGNSVHDSADEAVVEQKTVEVHMKEYKFQPAFAASFGILTQGEEKADSDGNPAADQEADGDDDSDSNSDSGPGTDTDGGSGTDTDKDSDTETGAGADKGSDTGTGAGADKDSDTETGAGADKDSDTGTGTDTDKDTDAGVDTDKDSDTDSGADTDKDTDTDKNQDTGTSTDEDQDGAQSVETAAIENITWKSAPEYDGDTEGCYIFTPVIPENYILADGVALPEITVMVGELVAAFSAKGVGTPGCGTISTDTVWNTAGTLSNGELIVEPGVTLTINDCISITGKVMIKGGGTIKRGSAAAYFHVNPGADLTVGEITLEGSSIEANDSMISTDNAKILLDDGCRIQNCHKTNPKAGAGIGGGGAAMYLYRGEAVINNIIIEKCSGPGLGGAICLRETAMTVNGGTYKDNRDTGTLYCAGSVIYSIYSKLYIYSGSFINNTAYSNFMAGCITDIGAASMGYINETHLYGGYFEGNKSTSKDSVWGGAIQYISRDYGSPTVIDKTIFELSGDVRFCGDGVEGSGIDGFFLDFVKFPRKIHVGSPIISPVYVYLNAKEGYVIAKGSDNGYILTEKDMKQIHFTDVGNAGKQWYAWLDKEKNEIYLSEKKPPYGLYVYYSSNGATGKVEDNTEYASGAEVTVKSADALSMKGCRFKEWNTRPDGKGTPYSPDSTFKITEDVTLYAIFEESGAIKADFYSGSAGHKDVISEDLEEDADSVTITAPELQDMGGWTKVGWDENVGGYTGAIAPNTQLTISKNMSYYGVYKRNVTLSYDANGGKDSDTPAGGTGECRANVHHEITYDMAEFSVAGAIAADNSEWVFVGWNTRQDGTGDSYNENNVIEIAEDTTLYATFVKPPYANFYSGKAGEFDRRGSIVSGGSSTTGPIITPHLREKTGWEEIGWDEAKTGYEGKIKPDSKITLTEAEENKPYYGVYEKKVTLSYQVLNNEYEGGNIPADSTQTRRAKVCETEITYDLESDDPDAFVFDIASGLSMEGYEFLGWNTRADGKGDFYSKEDAERNRITVTEDTVLYGIFSMAPAATFYSGSAGDYVTVMSEMSDGGATGILTGTLTAPELKEMEGWEPVGWSRSESGYEESVETEGGRDITITEDTAFYGIYRKKVELSYDANGWLDTAPDRQSRFRYANVHSEVTSTTAEFSVGNDSSREGYTFRGWSLEKDADGDCYRPEDTITLEASAVLYAQMVDDIAPVLGETAYNNGCRDVDDWIVRKKDLVLTVPVTEKGSGVDRIVYTFTPEDGEPVTGEALMEDAGESGQAQQTEAVWLETVSTGTTDDEVNATAVDRTAGADAQDDVADRAGRSGGQVGTADGEIQARITVSEDYKGAISLMCRDNAGNESPRKLLTTQGGGVIVEDNAPLISFRHKGSKNGKAVVEVTVYDNADEDSSSRITGGIASVDYRIDQKQAQSVTDQGFAEGVVETCTFEVEVAGAGEHTVKVTAADNAGNESSRSTSVRIAGDTGHKKETTVIKTSAPPAGEGSAPEPPAVESSQPAPPTEARELEPPTEKEPKTGDHAPNVEIYATLAMIAGLLYVLLYFIAEQGGMTEAEKNETVARLIAWAKRGAKIRRYAALAVIFCVLFYYHSIGKSTVEDFKKVRIMNN